MYLDRAIKIASDRGGKCLSNKCRITKSNGKQELDIWVPDLKLAIEYDGQQHFVPVRFGNCSKKKAQAALKYTQELDKLKNKKIAQHPEDVQFFIRFNYTEEIILEYVLAKLLKYNVPIEVK